MRSLAANFGFRVYTSGYSVEVFEGQLELRKGNNFLAKPYQTGALVTIFGRGGVRPKEGLRGGAI